jgi:hypothetical protein
MKRAQKAVQLKKTTSIIPMAKQVFSIAQVLFSLYSGLFMRAPYSPKGPSETQTELVPPSQCPQSELAMKRSWYTAAMKAPKKSMSTKETKIAERLVELYRIRVSRHQKTARTLTMNMTRM